MACLELAVAIAVLVAATAAAAADPHDDMAMGGGSTESQFGAGASLIAASYGPTTYFVGNYQGVMPAASFTRGAWSASAMLGAYRLEENGRVVYGLGDLMLAGGATFIDDGTWRAGVTAAAMLPTGDENVGLGMGHVMAMPSVWLARSVGAAKLRASAGYNRALTDLAGHIHGLWPLVEPMNLQEITWDVSASLPAWRKLEVGARVAGGVPFGIAMGVDRAAGALRASWVDSSVTTAVELQAGIIGDPYIVRGLVEMMVRF